MTARSIGHATIMFGVVAVPIKLYSTSETSDGVSFNLLHAEDKSRLEQVFRCKTCGEIVEREKAIKGYEHAKDCYVTFTNEELEAIAAVATEQIELVEYHPSEELDPLYVEKTYYIGPDKGCDQVFKLLNDALAGTTCIALGRWAAKGKEHMVAIRSTSGDLQLHQLRYQSEVKDWTEIPQRNLDARVSPVELRLAKQIIAAGSSSRGLDLGRFHDRVTERAKKLIASKVESGEVIAAPPTPTAAPTPQAGDALLEQLRASLDVAIKNSPPRSTKKPAKAPKKKRAA